MDTADYIRTLYDSMYWTRDRILGAAQGMSEEEYARLNGFNYKSIRGILTHTLGSEVAWLSRLRGHAAPSSSTPEGISETNLPTVEALQARWSVQEKATRGFLDGVTDAALPQEIVFTRRDGAEVRMPLWHILTLVYQHTLQHRSEAAEALTMVGRSPGGLDFTDYIAAQAAR